MDKKIKMLVIPSDRTGVGKFRSVDPHVYIAEHYGDEFDVDIVYSMPNGDLEAFLKQYDLIHIHKQLDKNCQIMDMIKFLGIPVIIDENGQQIGDWYNSYSIIDKEGIAAGSIGEKTYSDRCDIISASEKKVIAQFKHLDRANSASKNILVLTNDGEKKIYNYAKREFAYPEFETIQGIINYHYSLFCKLRGREDAVIFDFDTQKVTANNVLNVKMLDKLDDIVRLEKTNNKFNAYSVESAKELLQTDVDEIQYLARNIIYKIGETYHVYNWSQKKVVLNPNGFNIPPSEIDTYNDRVCFQVDKYFVVFRLTSYQCKFDYWGIQTNPVGPPDKYSYDLDENTPPEVINLYNTISGEGQEVQQQPQQQEPALSTVGENFKRFMKRIDEADKLRKRQIFD